MPEPRLELDGERVTARLIPQRGTNGGFSLVINGVTQSHVNPEDPLDLQLEYARLVAAVIDATSPGPAPLRVLHLGGGALTLPRWVGATRPASRQRAVELHDELIAFVLDALPLRPEVDLEVEIGDARAAVERAQGSETGYDVVIVDVFSGSVTPRALSTREFFALLRGLLTPGGIVAVNTLALEGLELSRELAATLDEVFDEVVLLAASAILGGTGRGNLVLAASDSPFPVGGIDELVGGNPRPVEILIDDDLAAFAGDARVRRDPDVD